MLRFHGSGVTVSGFEKIGRFWCYAYFLHGSGVTPPFEPALMVLRLRFWCYAWQGKISPAVLVLHLQFWCYGFSVFAGSFDTQYQQQDHEEKVFVSASGVSQRGVYRAVPHPAIQQVC